MDMPENWCPVLVTIGNEEYPAIVMSGSWIFSESTCKRLELDPDKNHFELADQITKWRYRE